MGSGASTEVSAVVAVGEAFQDPAGGDLVEQFTLTSLENADKMRIVRSFVRDEGANEAFRSFLKSEYAEENWRFFNEVEELKCTDSKSVAATTRQLSSKYLDSSSPIEINVSDRLKTMLAMQLDEESTDAAIAAATEGAARSASEESSFRAASRRNSSFSGGVGLVGVLAQMQKEILITLAMGSFPRFVQSQFYQEWRAQQRSLVHVALQQQQDMESSPESSSRKVTSSVNSISSIKDAEDVSVNVISGSEEETARLVEIFETVDALERPTLLARKSWMPWFMASVETLPICVTISTASSTRRGFPLVYVNAEFERMSGYPRRSIVGSNCRFLQTNERTSAASEPDSILRLTEALRDALPVRVVITNFRKDGVPFKNLLAMKPIFDSTPSRNYRYVVGVQFDVSNEATSPTHFTLANSLIDTLPDVIDLD